VLVIILATSFFHRFSTNVLRISISRIPEISAKVRDIVIFFFHGEILVFLVQIVNFVNCLILLGLIDVKYSDTCIVLTSILMYVFW
jgi:hypothetical protein